jgi:hypothetical protein
MKKYDLTIKVKDCEIDVKGNYCNEEGLTIDHAKGDIACALVWGVTIDDIEMAILDKLTDF